MPRRILLGVVAAGVLALALGALLGRTSLAFTLGVQPGGPVIPVAPGQTACQAPIDVPSDAAFDQVAVPVGTYFKPGSPLVVTVADAGNRVVARGRLAGGYPDIAQRPLERIPLDRKVGAPRIAVCLKNAGPRKIALYGNGALASRTSAAFLDGKGLRYDISFSFERAPRSLASLLPAIARRAALWRFPGMPGWIYLLIGLAVLVGGPALLARALRSATPTS
jgi:hypothetical protein